MAAVRGAVAAHFTAAVIASLPAIAVLLLISQLSPFSALVVGTLATVSPGAAYLALASTVSLAAALWYAHRSGGTGKYFWACWWAVYALSSLTAVLSVPHHPCFSIAFLAFLGPLLLYPLRFCFVGDSAADAADWLCVSWVATACAACICLVAWAPWIWFGFSGRGKWTDWTPQVRDLVQQGIISWKCAFAMWACPPCISLELVLVAVLCWVRQRYASLPAGLDATEDQSHAQTKGAMLSNSVKQVAGWLFALVMLIWIQATLNATGQQELNQKREDMSDEVIGLAFLLFLTMSLWVLDTLGPDEVAAAMKQSKMVQETANLLQSDWTRAFFFLCASVPLGILAAFHMAFSWAVGRGKEQEGPPLGQWTSDWRWTSILVKASWLGQTYMLLLVGVGKFTTILLAEINQHFSGWPVFTVSAVMFVLALLIFLFPASPGPPIYVVMGIVICSSAEKQGWSFTEGFLWATFVAYAMKLSFTAVAQKFIGESFSKNDRVRQAIGIHQPYMRAVEMILREPRITVAKSSLLIGGPDWPVAVLCGVLRLSVVSVQVCISPVLLQSVFPSVLAGALLLKQSAEAQGERRSHGMAEVTLVIAGALQLIVGVVAFYYVQEVLEKNYDVLSESRPEDKELEELEAKSEARDRAFWHESSWELLPCWLKGVLVFGVVCVQASVALVSVEPSCFKKFGLMSSVHKDLGGSALNIIQPWGWVAVTFALLDTVALAAFYLWTSYGNPPARTLVEKMQREQEGKAIL